MSKTFIDILNDYSKTLEILNKMMKYSIEDKNWKQAAMDDLKTLFSRISTKVAELEPILVFPDGTIPSANEITDMSNTQRYSLSSMTDPDEDDIFQAEQLQNAKYETEIRLQFICPRNSMKGIRDLYLHYGSSDYDQDHHGSWACGFIHWGMQDRDIYDLLQTLIADAYIQYWDTVTSSKDCWLDTNVFVQIDESQEQIDEILVSKHLEGGIALGLYNVADGFDIDNEMSFIRITLGYSELSYKKTLINPGIEKDYPFLTRVMRRKGILRKSHQKIQSLVLNKEMSIYEIINKQIIEVYEGHFGKEDNI